MFNFTFSWTGGNSYFKGKIKAKVTSTLRITAKRLEKQKIFFFSFINANEFLMVNLSSTIKLAVITLPSVFDRTRKKPENNLLLGSTITLFISNENNLNTITTVVQWLSLQNFIKQSLNSGSAQAQILLAACRRFGVVGISDNGLGWKYLLSVNHTTKKKKKKIKNDELKLPDLSII